MPDLHLNDQSPPELLAQMGLKAFQAQDLQKAKECFQAAREGFTNSGNSTKEAAMANNLSVILLKNGDAKAALQIADGTDKIFAEASDPQRQAMAFGNQGAALEALGQLKDALIVYQKSSDLLKQTGDKENRSIVLASISQIEMRMGQPLEAMVSMQISLDNRPKLSFREKLLNKLLKVPFKFLGH